VAVLRHELFRDSFRLNPNNMGITGEDIDREFCMSDTYKGNYTFKVRGPGMMGPFLDEDSSEPLAEGSRSYLHEGGTTLIGFKARREYWVEIMSDPDAFGSEIKEAILRTETEIARIDLKAKDIVDLVDQQQAKDTSDLMEKQQQQQQQQQQLQQVLDGDDLGALQSTLNDMADAVVVKVERNTTTTITYTSDSDDEL